MSFWYCQFSQKTKKKISTLLLWYLKLNCFRLFFGRIEDTKDIQKLTDLYRQTGNYLRKYVFKKRIIGLNISLFYVYFFLPECVVPIGRSPCSPEFLKDLYQVQEETWKFFFLAHIQLCVPYLILSKKKIKKIHNLFYKRY